MKVIQRKRKPEPFWVYATCTGKYCGGDGCGADLAVEQSDMYIIWLNFTIFEPIISVAFTCCECGVETVIWLANHGRTELCCRIPTHIFRTLPTKWEHPLYAEE